MKKGWVYLLLLVTVAALVWAQTVGRRYREASLRADSLEASADTARRVMLAALDDSTRAYQLRAIQADLKLDSLDRELRERPVVRIAAGVRVDTLRMIDTVEVPTMGADTVRRYAFSGADGPFAFRGDARIWPAGRGVFEVRVGMSRAVTVAARITCGRGAGGIATASVLLTAEDPFHLVPESVFQDPEVCNPTVPILSFSTGKALWAGAGFLGGLVLSNLLLLR